MKRSAQSSNNQVTARVDFAGSDLLNHCCHLGQWLFCDFDQRFSFGRYHIALYTLAGGYRSLFSARGGLQRLQKGYQRVPVRLAQLAHVALGPGRLASVPHDGLHQGAGTAIVQIVRGIRYALIQAYTP